jgi:trk system potassium uptake protein TrkH
MLSITISFHEVFRKIGKNDELWFYVFMVTASVCFVTIVLFYGTDRNFELSFRDAFFQVTSQISCTGFATTDYMKFPPLGWFFMFIIMFLGRSTGSTTGGIKMGRHLIALKNREIQFNQTAPSIRCDPGTDEPGRRVTDDTVNQVVVFIFLYILTFLAGNVIMQVSGISILEASGAAATSMAGIGPGLGPSGNMGNYAHFNPVAKVTMILLMIAGRLELFTFITVFTRPFRRI